MSRDHWRPERTRPSPWGAIALVMLTGVALMRNGPELLPGPPQPLGAASAGRHPVSAGALVAGAAETPRACAPASRVVIPSIRVDAPLVEVAPDRNGCIEAPAPQDPTLAGRNRNGVAPGRVGMSVFAGVMARPAVSTVSVR
ncbi:hypothetical protein ACFU8W_01585 [Streptomyces sp. NPDC057565]|uniref:hypothetical protein n=1 Tax=Streptomyces sp. NPDC057565 TaxID=3346169 RepID=UPI003681D076